jgi:GxxExxY protein
MDDNEITGLIIGKAIEIHRGLGPGLYEKIYHDILFYELEKAGLKLEKEKPIPILWKGLTFGYGYKADLVVENKIVVELKSVETLLPVHKMQTLTYTKLLNLRFGLLINFNVDVLKAGIRRVVNGY